MKFVVDKMPKQKNECPLSSWKPYPPILEKPGDYVCKHDGKICDLSEEECRWLKQESR